MEVNTEPTMNPESVRTKLVWGKGALLVFLLLLLANVLFLDFEVFKRLKRAEIPDEGKLIFEESLSSLGTERETSSSSAFILEETPSTPTPQAKEPQAEEPNVCPSACLEAITKVTASVVPSSTPAQKPTAPELKVKEMYIPLGSGSTTSKNWVELTGVEAVVDKANFPNIKSMIFEASMRIPTANGKVYAKLYNVTDKHDVWYSEVWAEGPSGYRAESAEITLSSGRKLYRVMMKSTMGYEAVLDSARIKILLK